MREIIFLGGAFSTIDFTVQFTDVAIQPPEAGEMAVDLFVSGNWPNFKGNTPPC